VAIEPPDLRTRVNLLWNLANRAAENNLPDPDALREIAGRVPGNVRLLEGALTRVIALASVFSEPIDRALVQRALGSGDGSRAVKPAMGAVIAPSVAAIQESVCSVLGVAPDQLRSSSRIPRVSRARQLSMYLAREMTPLSLAQIAREFNRDHSTVIHSIRAVEGRLEPGSETLKDLHNARRSLAGYVEEGEQGEDSLHHRSSSQHDH
jgi:chromosomal replication initiator protein